MEEIIGTNVYATAPVEIGGMNTALAALLASLADIPFVDADTIGRAKPELEMQSYTLYGIPITPLRGPFLSCGVGPRVSDVL